jgi:hypothetical protein
MTYRVHLPDGTAKAFGECTAEDLQAPISHSGGWQFPPAQLHELAKDMRAEGKARVMDLGDRGEDVATWWAHHLGVDSGITPPGAH